MDENGDDDVEGKMRVLIKMKKKVDGIVDKNIKVK